MNQLESFLDLFIHLDYHMNTLIQNFGIWTYLILFLIIFCETGLVVTPFLPGDSLLFMIGTFAANESFHLLTILGLLILSAILGDTVNYWIGNLLAPKIFRHENIRFLNKKYLERTHRFYEKYGGKTIMIARFVPIIRTFAPFLAGAGRMGYGRFLFYNVIGGILWISSFVLGGFFFGNLPTVKNHFSLFIFGIIIVSLLPGLIEYLRHRKDYS